LQEARISFEFRQFSRLGRPAQPILVRVLREGPTRPGVSVPGMPIRERSWADELDVAKGKLLQDLAKLKATIAAMNAKLD
jgi:hypothetical protein